MLAGVAAADAVGVGAGADMPPGVHAGAEAEGVQLEAFGFIVFVLFPDGKQRKGSSEKTTS